MCRTWRKEAYAYLKAKHNSKCLGLPFYICLLLLFCFLCLQQNILLFQQTLLANHRTSTAFFKADVAVYT